MSAASSGPPEGTTVEATVASPGFLSTGKRELLARQGILLAMCLCIAAFGIFSDRFFSVANLMAVLRQSSIVGAIAIGVTVVVIGGNLDLSVGSLLSFATVLVVDLHDRIGPAGAILCMFAAVLVVGLLNGVLVGMLRLNSLIVTLGMLSVIQGVTLIYTGGQNVDIRHPETTWFAVFGRGSVFGIPVPIVIFLLLAVAVELMLRGLPFGRRVFAVGGNPTAAVFSGIRRGRVVLGTYLVSAMATGFAAVIMGSRVMGSQNNVGEGYELTALAGVILGGASLMGGSGSALRTVIGVLILGLIQNGLLMLGFLYSVQWLVTWGVIIVAVWFDLAARRGRLFSDIP